MSDAPPPSGSDPTGKPPGSWDAPPPPPPPPPPGAYGAPPPPYAQPGFGASPTWVPAAGPLAEWPQRVLGSLVDFVPALAMVIVVFIVSLILGKIASALGVLVGLVGYLAVFGYYILQLIKQGNTGQTIGKKIIGLKLVKIETQQPIGAGMSVVRQIAHFADSLICDIGYLFPLWDPKKQTLADKIMGTVVVTVPKQPFNAEDLYTTT